MDRAKLRRGNQKEASKQYPVALSLRRLLFLSFKVSIAANRAIFLLTFHSLLNDYLPYRKELIPPMTYVVVELCVDCKYTDCAAVCPVEAFHELPDRLYINADTCIDCDACVPECPVEAIFADNNVPENYAHWTQINIDEAPKYPVISAKIPALHGPSCTGPEE
jgi:ferredoxin